MRSPLLASTPLWLLLAAAPGVAPAAPADPPTPLTPPPIVGRELEPTRAVAPAARPRAAAPNYMPGWVVPQGYRAPAEAPPPPAPPVRTRVFPTDTSLQRVQAAPPLAPAPTPADAARNAAATAGEAARALPDALPPGASLPVTSAVAAEGAGTAIGLQAALYGALTNNPDLVTLRNSNIASPEAVEVARRFPTTLNPTVWVDYRPISLIPSGTFANQGGAHSGGPYYHHGTGFFYISLRQPIELGHQTTHRHDIAKAALNQQQWTVVQAELLALVQTYRFFQTAAYRREKVRIARELADFNDRLLESLKRRLETTTLVTAADVVLGEVENRATRQQLEVANQDYANALADLRNQLGLPETANTAEPLGELVLPRAIPDIDEAAMVQMAKRCRPDVHVARAQAAGAAAAVRLAKGDRRPTPVVGPLYQTDEVGVQYVGLVYISQIPILNNGRPLQLQREAEYRRTIVALRQVEQRAETQVRSAVAKWNAANRLVNQTVGLTGSLRAEVGRMEQLFEANQADLTRLLQARQRLLQLQNAELDAVWQATQAQADLLTALGAPGLIAALNAPAPVIAPLSVGPGAADAPAPH